MAVVMLRDVCGVRSGDKGDISDLSLFADDRETYDALVERVTAERVKEHFAEFVAGPVERFLVPNLLAIKFVMHGALGGGTLGLRSDIMGKTFGLSLLRLEVDLPEGLVARSWRRTRPAVEGGTGMPRPRDAAS